MTSTAQNELDNIRNGEYGPIGIIPADADRYLVHEGDDNIDINCHTIDGINTFHSMACVVFK